MTKHDLLKYTTALGLQGGGALGKYQVGVYRGMKEHGFEPSVVAGISIGSINCAVIAGNEVDDRLPALQGLWIDLAKGGFWPSVGVPAIDHLSGFANALAFGQSKFFTPWLFPPAFSLPGSPSATSYYDTAPLRETLLKHVNFDLLNDKSREDRARLIVGAVEVESARMVWFDNFEREIGPEHIMASGALPPAFNGVRIDGKLYWDGGIHSNKVLDALAERIRRTDLHVVLPSLFNATGEEPKTMQQVMRRLKEIEYGSEARTEIEHGKKAHDLRLKLNHVLQHLPKHLQDELEEFWPAGRSHELHVTSVSLKAPDYETDGNDADFSTSSLARREREGYEDIMEAFGHMHG